MTPLISCQSLTKSHGVRPLFRGITLGIAPEEHVGLIGPNGAGKSTLLKLLAGREKPDSGTISTPKSLRLAYLAQEDMFLPDQTVEDVLLDALVAESLDDRERATRISITLSRVGFDSAQRQQVAATLSGGWRKRLSLAREMVRQPDLLLLDEPTNHLDLEGVLWLEKMLQESPFAYLVVTHDRYFLENVAKRIIELNPAYADGYLSIEGTYTDFLIKREEYLNQQAHREQALASIVRREIEWLRRGAQARSTKAKGRIEAAGKLIDDLAEVRFRNDQNKSVGIDFSSSGRRTKELLIARGLEKTLGGRTLFQNLDMTLTRGMKLGLIGANGSGKSTLIRILTGVIPPDKGSVKAADGLKIVLFDQNREQLDKDLTLKEALSPNSDTVVYRDSTMHVSGWAKRFLFRSEQLPMEVKYLSGGEQSRILIARLMLQPADVLILDEPTNDLDIPSLEVLEESLASFPGAIILVTHDRYLLDRVSTEVLALEGHGGARSFVDYDQWAEWNEKNPAKRTADPTTTTKNVKMTGAAPSNARLNTAERRELSQMEDKISAADAVVAELERQMVDPTIATDAKRLQECWDALPIARAEVERLYARWEELEARRSA